MSERPDMRREIEEALDEIAAESGLGIARAPTPEPVAMPLDAEAASHGHGHEHMVTFGMWEVDDDGNLVEVDPARFGRYEPGADESPVRAPEGGGEAEGTPHVAGGHEPARATPSRRRRTQRKDEPGG